MNRFGLEDRIAIVTGGGRNIGKAIALGLAEAGANVVVASRTASEIESTAAEIREMGRKALAISTDVRKIDEVNDLVDKTIKEFNRIDILVNNAGTVFVASTLEMSEGAWDALIRENLKSVFLCSKAVGKVMVSQQSGAIINISSVAGIHTYPINAAYGASKAGIISLTRTMAMDLAQYHIRVNSISPGYIAQPTMLLAFPTPPKTVAPIPMGRFGEPEDVVGAVIYLASDASSYVTGENIVIDGGLLWIPAITLSQ